MRPILLIFLAVACGAGKPQVTIAIVPASSFLTVQTTRAFTAAVTGSADTAVVWSVTEGNAGGSINAAGNYTAPALAGSFHVVAASVADPSKSASAMVSVVAAPAMPVITAPATATTGTAGLQASVTPASGSTYAWTIDGGTLTAGAATSVITFTAGAIGTMRLSCIVTNAAGTASPPGTAAVQVRALIAVSIDPLTLSITVRQTHVFHATVTGTTNTGVTWSIDPLGGGSIDGAGNYLAPAAPGAVTVVATSVADLSQHASAAVLVVAVPATPVITAPAYITAGSDGTASVPSQAGATFGWTLTGGTLKSAAGVEQIVFTAGAPGTLGLACIATNAAGTASSAGTATVLVKPVQHTLTVLTVGSVTGTPAAGRTLLDAGTQVSYAFSPGSGSSSALVEVDGALSATSGTVTMNADHIVWAFGQPAAGTDFTNMMTVPSDPTLIPYPQFYAAQPSFTARIADPYCGLETEAVAYPRSYLGAFPMPAIRGGPLAAATARGVMLKDFWSGTYANPATNQGCTGDWHAAVTKTMARAKRIGADHVVIFQNSKIVDITASPMQFNCMGGGTTCQEGDQISDSEIAWAAQAAGSLGLKLYLYTQVEGVDTHNNVFPSAPSAAFINGYFDAYQRYMAHKAAVAQGAGIPVMGVDWGVWWIEWTQPQYLTLFRTRMKQVADAMRVVFQGKLLAGTLDPWAMDDAALMGSIDGISVAGLFSIQSQFTAADNANITTDQLKDKYLVVMGWYANLLKKYHKPAYFLVSTESYRDVLRDGWVEDGFCPATPCPEMTLQTDFSVQAISIEAQLETILGQSDFEVADVDIGDYWYVDVMLPKESFPNLSHSIRNKPAESITYDWFKQP